jgi:hypothetical protein
LCNLPTGCRRFWADCRTKAPALAVDITGSRRGQKVTSEQVVSGTYTGPTTVIITSLNDGAAQLIG